MTKEEEKTEDVSMELEKRTGAEIMSYKADDIMLAQKRLDESKERLATGERGFRKQIGHLTEQITATQKMMEDATRPELFEVKTREDLLQREKDDLLATWYGEEKTFTIDDGTRFQKRVTKGFEVKDPDALLERCQALEKPPYTPKYDTKKLITLIEVGVIPTIEAILTTRESLAIYPPKKEEESEPSLARTADVDTVAAVSDCAYPEEFPMTEEEEADIHKESLKEDELLENQEDKKEGE